MLQLRTVPGATPSSRASSATVSQAPRSAASASPRATASGSAGGGGGASAAASWARAARPSLPAAGDGSDRPADRRGPSLPAAGDGSDGLGVRGSLPLASTGAAPGKLRNVPPACKCSASRSPRGTNSAGQTVRVLLSRRSSTPRAAARAFTLFRLLTPQRSPASARERSTSSGSSGVTDGSGWWH